MNDNKWLEVVKYKEGLARRAAFLEAAEMAGNRALHLCQVHDSSDNAGTQEVTAFGEVELLALETRLRAKAEEVT